MKPKPFSPVHKARKFSAVCGTSSPYNPMTILPTSFPTGFPIPISKYTLLVTFDCNSATSALALTELRTRDFIGDEVVREAKRSEPEKNKLDEDEETLDGNKFLLGNFTALHAVELPDFTRDMVFIGLNSEPTFGRVVKEAAIDGDRDSLKREREKEWASE